MRHDFVVTLRVGVLDQDMEPDRPNGFYSLEYKKEAEEAQNAFNKRRISDVATAALGAALKVLEESGYTVSNLSVGTFDETEVNRK